MDEKDDTVMVTKVNFLTLQSAQNPAATDQEYLVISIERDEGQIEQIGISHADGQNLLAELIQGLMSQGSAVAKLLHDTLQETLEQDEDENEDVEFQPADADADDENAELLEGDDDPEDPLNLEADDFDPGE